MKLSEFLNTLSANSLKEHIVKSNKWTNWHDFPETINEFCSFFDLENDETIDVYHCIIRSSYKEIRFSVPIQFQLPTGKVSYKFGFIVDGYKKPNIGIFEWGGYHKELEIDFGWKYQPPTMKKNKDVKRYPITYDLKNDVFCKIDNNTTIGEVLHNIENIVNELNPVLKTVIDAFYDGTYMQVFKNTGIKPINGYFMSEGFALPYFCSLVNMLYLAKKKLNYDLSVQDAALLNLYTSKQPVHTNSLKHRPSSKFDFVNMWSFWNRDGYEDTESTEVTLEQLQSCIKTAKKAMSLNASEVEEYKETISKANRYILEKLRDAINEASEQYNIKSKHLCLYGFSNSKDWDMFEEEITQAPKGWKLRK